MAVTSIRTTALLAVLAIAGAGSSTASAMPPAPPPSVAASQAAYAAWRQGAWHFEGNIVGMPPGRTLMLALTPTEAGLVGETLIVDPDRVIRDAAPVRGSLAGGRCHLVITVLGAPARLDGICNPELVAGRVTNPHRPASLLASLLLPPGFDGQEDPRGLGLAGEAWLAPTSVQYGPGG